MALNLILNIHEKCTQLTLKGSVNEHATELDGFQVNPEFDLLLNLKDLVAINSIGIRNFRSWIWQVKSPRIRLVHCQRPFIEQLNKVDQFLPPRTEIESFYVPYYSEETATEKVVLYEKGVQFHITGGVVRVDPVQILDSEGKPMVLDIFDDRYFKFLEVYKN